MPRTHKPVSPKQLAANRANAALSAGPKTPEGKARSARNSVKHGFTAASFAVVRLEDVHEVAHLASDLVSVYQPVNSQELFALQRMAISQQAILRAARLESGLFTTCLNETLDANDHPAFPMNQLLSGDGEMEITRAQNRNYLLGEGFLRLARQSNGWTLFLRYQAQAERQYRRALEDFDRLKALRPGLPIQDLPDEPISPPEPQHPTTTYTPSETNPSPSEIAPSTVVPAAAAILHPIPIPPQPFRSHAGSPAPLRARAAPAVSTWHPFPATRRASTHRRHRTTARANRLFRTGRSRRMAPLAGSREDNRRS